MLTVVLVLLACAGGGTVAYFIMDEPRRQADERLRKLDQDRRRFDDDRRDLAEQMRAADARARGLKAAAADLDSRSADLATKVRAFDARVIQYDDLAAENRLLRADLRNLLLRLSRHEYAEHEAARTGAGVAGRRDQFASLYIAEVIAAAKRTLTTSNYSTAKNRVTAAFGRVQAAGAAVPAADHDNAIRELEALYEKALRSEALKEGQAELRKVMREDLQRQREIVEAQEAARRAEEERAAIAAAVARAVAAARGQHSAEVDQLQRQLAEAEEKAQRTKSNAEKGIRRGNVYVISNIGSFGEGVFKIGMTRRDEPQDRVDELGDASVPFSFDVHMMIHTEDAPELERTLHQRFRLNRCNRVNMRKEFFRVPLAEIEAAVRDCSGRLPFEVRTFEVEAKAAEYRESQRISDDELRQNAASFERVEQDLAADPTAED